MFRLGGKEGKERTGQSSEKKVETLLPLQKKRKGKGPEF